MNDRLTASVARLYRAGSEHSQETEKLRKAVDSLILWLLDHELADVQLPMCCEVWKDGTFTRSSGGFFQVRMGNKHLRDRLQLFSKLIVDGFLEELSTQLEKESITLNATVDKVNSFLSQA